MKYDPTSLDSRHSLARYLVRTLTDAGFTKVDEPRAREAVYARPVTGSPGVEVKVYTTIVASRSGPVVRSCGSDSIRVCAVYTGADGVSRGIVKNTRVHRVGEIDAVAERMLSRMREVWAASRTGERCRCGTPKFISRKGNTVCADFCWKRRAASGWSS